MMGLSVNCIGIHPYVLCTDTDHTGQWVALAAPIALPDARQHGIVTIQADTDDTDW